MQVLLPQVEEGKQERRHVLTFTFTSHEWVWERNLYQQRFMWRMQQRTIVRSLTTSDGTLVAMNDGTVVWKPIEGRPTRTVLEDLPTVLLALRGPMGPVDAAAVGTAAGDVLVLTLPRLETVAKFQLQSGSVRAITLVAEGAFHFLVGTQHGAVWLSLIHISEPTRH